MAGPDLTTLQPRPRKGTHAPSAELALTILAHPDPARVGARAAVVGGLEVGRLTPTFHGEGHVSSPLLDPYVSRRALELRPRGDAVAITCHGGVWSLDGVPGGTDVRIPRSALSRGVVLGLADRVLLLLELQHPELQRSGLGLVGPSEGLAQVRRDVERAAGSDVPVLVVGETGTGKELVAAAIHRASRRAERPYLAVNLAALAPSTAASELFGHARGAFTGADRARPGWFGRAHGGTLLLDEVGETPSPVQPMLLRALETGEIQPVGEGPRTVDVRVVAATDADLDGLVAQGRFRAPLLHRLRGWTIRVPPLRDRLADIAVLALHFLRQELSALGAGARLSPAGTGDPWLGADVVGALLRAPWHGNVRELRQVVRVIAVGSHDLDAAVWAGRPEAPAPDTPQDLEDDAAVAAALEAHSYSVGAAARALGVAKNTLYARIEAIDGLRLARSLSEAEIRAAWEAGGLKQAAQELKVSARSLRLRMTALGLEL